MTPLTFKPIVSEKRRCRRVPSRFLISASKCFLVICISDIKTLLSQLWGTRRNCHRRRDVAQFCSSPNYRDGRCVCVSCFFFCLPAITKYLPNDLIPDPLFERSHGIFCNSLQLSHLIIILLTDTQQHPHTPIRCPVCHTAVVSECVTLQVTSAPASHSRTYTLHNALQTPFHAVLLDTLTDPSLK